MITKEDIVKAYAKIRIIDSSIPDEVLDFMKQASIDKLSNVDLEQKIVLGFEWADQRLQLVNDGLNQTQKDYLLMGLKGHLTK